MNRKRILAVFLMLCCLWMCATAFAGDAGELTFTKEKLIVSVSKTATIKHKLTPSSLSKSGVTYESSNKDIAAVSSNGQVKGKAVGECVVTVTSKKDPSVSAQLPVYVVKPVTTIRASAESKTLMVGQTVQITHTVKPEDATMQGATYETRTEKVVRVDANGLLTAVGRGKASVVVRSEDGKSQHTLEFTVKQPAEEITFKNSEYNVVAGKSLKLAATVKPSNADDKRVVWESSDKNIATVDKSGVVKTKAVGDVVITASCQSNPLIRTHVTVHSVNPISSISFAQSVYDTGVGDQIQLKPIIKPFDASHTKLRYEAQNRQVCSVDENGLITTLRGGITTVKAIATDGSRKSATITLRSIVPVAGVYFEQKSVRVDVGSHTFAYAKLVPLDATLKDMKWYSSDPSVATVSGSDNRVRIIGHKWGRCVVTGVTEQGGYTASIAVNVGALRSPLAITDIQNADGVPCVFIRNVSDMHITGLTLSVMKGESPRDPVSAVVDLAPGAETMVPLTSMAKLSNVKAAVSAWETDTGFYTNEDELLYAYRISPGLLEWAN